MIYIITNTPSRFPQNPIYRIGTMEMLMEYFQANSEIYLDAETKGLDPHTHPLICLQVGDYDNQYIIDCESVDVTQFKEVLESKLVVGQNLKFDIRFLFKKGIYLRNIYDTFVAEKVLNCGLNMIRAGLDALTGRYCDVVLDKSVRVDIPKEGLSPRVISYAADDIKHLPEIKKKQLEKAKEQELISVINLENKFTPALAYIEYCGFKLDAKKWTQKMLADQELMDTLKNNLDQWIVSKGMNQYIQQQLNMFSDQGCTINWASPKQVTAFFEEQGIDCTVVEKGIKKKSIEASHLEKYRASHEIVGMYLDYKKAEKVVSTYGDSFIKQIHPTTNRIHTKFNQIMDTGRMSSGGKDHVAKVNFINFQNIPRDKLTRSCFVAEEGNTLLVSDYSGQEQIVLANYCLDTALLKFYDTGLSDMHSFVASQMYPELQGMSLDDIKSNHSDKRQAAKSAGFALNYGGTGKTIADNLGITEEEGDKIYNAYFDAFPGVKVYFEKAKQQGLRDGYVLISPITKRKSYIPMFDRFAEVNEKIDKNYWTRYREVKKWDTPEAREMKQEVRDYFRFKGDIERKTLNFPIQGSSSEITKIATIYIYNWILDQELFWTVKICNSIHDELVIECPMDMSDKVSEITKHYMVLAGSFYCKRVPLLAEPEKTLYWKK